SSSKQHKLPSTRSSEVFAANTEISGWEPIVRGDIVNVDHIRPDVRPIVKYPISPSEQNKIASTRSSKVFASNTEVSGCKPLARGDIVNVDHIRPKVRPISIIIIQSASK